MDVGKRFSVFRYQYPSASRRYRFHEKYRWLECSITIPGDGKRYYLYESSSPFLKGRSVKLSRTQDAYWCFERLKDYPNSLVLKISYKASERYGYGSTPNHSGYRLGQPDSKEDNGPWQDVCFQAIKMAYTPFGKVKTFVTNPVYRSNTIIGGL